MCQQAHIKVIYGHTPSTSHLMFVTLSISAFSLTSFLLVLEKEVLFYEVLLLSIQVFAYFLQEQVCIIGLAF